MNEYYRGTTVRCSVTFKDAADVKANPGTVIFKFLDPSGNATSYLYGTDSEVVNPAVGEFHCDVYVDESGVWTQGWWGTDPVPAAAEAQFSVLESEFADLTILRGDSFSVSLTGLGSIANRSKLWFTVKKRKISLDIDAVIQIEVTAGLVRLNGMDASARSSNGSITVDEEDDGNITIALDEVETRALSEASGLYYDVQVLTTGGDVNTLTYGDLNVVLDVTRAVS